MQLPGIVGFQGKRLSIPRDCHPKLSDMLILCFGDKRPTFKDITSILRYYCKYIFSKI
jgi:hypothetical protein